MSHSTKNMKHEYNENVRTSELRDMEHLYNNDMLSTRSILILNQLRGLVAQHTVCEIANHTGV